MDTTKDTTQPGSVLDLIRQTRDDVAAEGQPLLIPLIAYQEKVALRFDYPDGGFGAIRKAVGGGAKQGRRVKADDDLLELNAVTDLMVTLCTGVVSVDGTLPEGEWPSLDPSGADLRINRTFAKLVNIEVPEDMRKVGRFILRHLYSPRAHETGKFNGDPALVADGSILQGWLDAGGVKVAEDLPGE